jgi:hypothetical protein
MVADGNALHVGIFRNFHRIIDSLQVPRDETIRRRIAGFQDEE